MATISVTIDGKTYRMGCDEGQEEHLSGLAEKLDQYIQHLKSSFGEIGDHRLSVMAGIMVMDEISDLRIEMDKLQAELKELKISRDAEVKKAQSFKHEVGITISRTAERLETLASRLASK